MSEINVFSFVNSINSAEKEDLFRNHPEGIDQAEKDYASYIVNRQFSYFSDTIGAANEMNMAAHIEKKFQYDFLRLFIRPRKRFSKWAKKQDDEYLELVKKHFGYSNQKAAEVLKLLKEEDLEKLKEIVNDTGGVKK